MFLCRKLRFVRLYQNVNERMNERTNERMNECYISVMNPILYRQTTAITRPLTACASRESNDKYKSAVVKKH